jgi:hypothetical protein
VTGSNHVASDACMRSRPERGWFGSDCQQPAALCSGAASGLATAASLLIVSDRVSYGLAVLVGACSDAPDAAAETYTLTIGGNYVYC